MVLEIHTLSWPDSNPALLRGHQRVMTKFGLSVSYWREQAAHSQWMDRILRDSHAEVVGFLDNDCIPTNADIIPYAVGHAARTKSFIGIAQVSNHIPPKCHVYAAPAGGG